MDRTLHGMETKNRAKGERTMNIYFFSLGAGSLVAFFGVFTYCLFQGISNQSMLILGLSLLGISCAGFILGLRTK